MTREASSRPRLIGHVCTREAGMPSAMPILSHHASVGDADFFFGIARRTRLQHFDVHHPTNLHFFLQQEKQHVKYQACIDDGLWELM